MKVLLGVTHVLQDGNQIGDRGAEMIGEGLKVNSSLQELYLVRLVVLICVLYCCWGDDGDNGYVQACYSNEYARVCAAFVLTYFFLQDKQSSGPFNFPGSSSLMRGCRNLSTLSFECCDWSACVASESWGELPVPPAEVIARGTQGVFEFVTVMLCGRGFHIHGEVFSMKSENIDLSRRNLNEDELLPLLESFRDGKFSSLKRMKLVIVFAYNLTKMPLGVTHVLQDGNQIGDRGAEMIGEGLKVNSSLQRLHLVRLFFCVEFLVVAGVMMERVGRSWAAV